MFKKTCLYGVAAIALSLIAVPAYAQTAPLTATTPPASKPAASAPSTSAAPSTSGGTVDFSGSSTTPTALENMAANAVAATDSMIDGLSGNGSLSPDEKNNTVTSDDGAFYEPADSSKPRWYDDNGNPFSEKYYEREPGGVLLALQRDPSLPVGHFVLFMSATNNFVGCVKIINPKHSTEFDENGIMTIKMEKFIIDKRDMPRYPHYECNTAPQEAGVHINLSKELLQDNNVKKIKFKTGKSSENYLVKITDDYIQLTPETRRNPQDISNRFRPLEVNGVATTMKLWFYPENTVILTADGTAKDITLESRLMDLARSKGLTPLDDVMPDHANFRKQPNRYYFVDKNDRYKVGNGELFDYIQVDTMKFGLEADEPIKKNVAVFISKPGQYD